MTKARDVVCFQLATNYNIIFRFECKATIVKATLVDVSLVFDVSALEYLRARSQLGRNELASIETCYTKRHKKEKTARLVKQRLPSVSTGRPQLLRTNIRHAVAAYGLMVTVQSELRRSAVRNAVRKTARVISAALCIPPNDRTGPTTTVRPLNPSAECTRNASGMPEKERPAVRSPPRFSEIKKNSFTRARAWFFWRHSIMKFLTRQISVIDQKKLK